MTRQAGATDFPKDSVIAAKVVSFPKKRGKKLEADVERISSYDFFDLGKLLQPITKLDGNGPDVAARTVFFDILDARGVVSKLLDDDPVPLGVSKAKCQALLIQLDNISNQYFKMRAADGTETWGYPEAEYPKIPSYQFQFLKNALLAFETVFQEEMREAGTYFVPSRGIYWTPALVDAADETFPDEIRAFIPDKAKDDWRAAGRCLAFNLLTASGFHAARAVEATMESYYQLCSGKAGKTLNSWSDYIGALKKLKEKSEEQAKKDKTFIPEEKVILEFDQMRVDYRNPLSHPRIVLSESDARVVYANSESLIVIMAQEISAIVLEQSMAAPILVAGLGAE